MRPQTLLAAGLSSLVMAAEASAQSSLYSPEASRIRMALAAFVALLLFFAIRRGVPARGSRRWFWEATADELGPDLARLRETAMNHILAGAFLLAAAVLAGGYAVGDALVEAYEQEGRWIDHLHGPMIVLVGVFVVLGTGLVVRGVRMAPDEPA